MLLTLWLAYRKIISFDSEDIFANFLAYPQVWCILFDDLANLLFDAQACNMLLINITHT